jgi:hypothetical protein
MIASVVSQNYVTLFFDPKYDEIVKSLISTTKTTKNTKEKIYNNFSFVLFVSSVVIKIEARFVTFYEAVK